MRGASSAYRRLCMTTAVVTYLLIVWGGIVRVTGSGLGCDSPSGGVDSWPLCRGGLLPPWNQAGLIEFTHRWLVTVTSCLVVAVVAVTWARYRSHRPLVVAASATAVLFVVQIALGALTVGATGGQKLTGGIVTLHLANAEILLAALVFIAVTASGAQVSWRNPPAKSRLAVAGAVATYVLILSGSNVVAQGAGPACFGWPFCGSPGSFGTTIAQMGLASVNLLHRFVAGGVLLLLGAMVPIVRKVHRGDRGLLMSGMLINVLLLLQIIAGALVVEIASFPSWARGIHLALASALWAVVVLFALLARGAPQEAAAGIASTTSRSLTPPSPAPAS